MTPEITVGDTEISITVGGKPVLTYVVAPQLPQERFADSLPEYYTRSGFIHPVFTPEGRVVTDDFPVGHVHQHGIFTAWTSAEHRGQHLDFWNQHHELGTARHAELLEIIDSAGVVGFRTRLQQVSLDAGPILQEDWYVRVHGEAAPFVWDLRSEQTNITEDTLYLNPYIYGGLGVRGSAAWNESDSNRYQSPPNFLTSEGLDRETANHTRPAWTALYGPVGERGDTVGMAVFPHPDDFRAPQYVRVHPDMPYLSVTPVVEEGFSIAPGGKYLSRYRFVVFDGQPGAVDLASYGWDAFPRK